MSDARRIFLVRHGEAAAKWGQSADPGLSELGHQQAAEAATELAAFPSGPALALWSSPLARAQETAAPLAATLGLDVTIDERFREIPSPTPLDGRQVWLRSFMQGQWTGQDASLHAWRSAMIEAVQALPDGAVVFTHFLVINALAGWVENDDRTLLVWPANASISVLAYDGTRWSFEAGEQMESRVN